MSDAEFIIYEDEYRAGSDAIKFNFDHDSLTISTPDNAKYYLFKDDVQELNRFLQQQEKTMVHPNASTAEFNRIMFSPGEPQTISARLDKLRFADRITDVLTKTGEDND